MPQSVSLIIVEKTGNLKLLTVKDYKEEELYKKCNFKKAEGFIVQNEWATKLNGQKYTIALYAKSDGKAGTENKYEFPPPIDSKLFFGACILVGYLRDDSGEKSLFNLTVPLWTAIYEKLFGGFQDLKSLDEDNEDDEDEVPEVKPKKNNFIVDSNSDADADAEDEYTSATDSDINTDDYESGEDNTNLEEQEELFLDDFGSELSEESYDYSDDE
jgi:hypothetical protein